MEKVRYWSEAEGLIKGYSTQDYVRDLLGVDRLRELSEAPSDEVANPLASGHAPTPYVKI